VTGQDASAVEGLFIAVAGPLAPGSGPESGFEVRVDRDGRLRPFLLRARPAGDYDLRLPGGTLIWEGVLPPADPLRLIPLDLSAFAAHRIRIVGRDGKSVPSPNATIRLVEPQAGMGRDRVLDTLAYREGTVLLHPRGDSPGWFPLDVLIEWPGYRPVRMEVPREGGKAGPPLEVPVPRGSGQVVVKAAENTGDARFHIELRNCGDPTVIYHGEWSPGTGELTLEPVLPGDYDWRILSGSVAGRVPSGVVGVPPGAVVELVVR
jgi:hypothetical protein